MSEALEGDVMEGRELVAEASTLATLHSADIDMQIATAHKYPRSIAAFRKEALQMVTLTEQVAGECIYALPRGGKVIEGPSARFAEVILSAWGNCRAGARTIDHGDEFVTAQGVCHDLQRNVSITFEVKRRITDSRGNRYNADMIGVTANAASSIALRNAILKVVPKAFWAEQYAAAKKVAGGDMETLGARRDAALKAFETYKVTPQQVLTRLGISGKQDITIDHMIILQGFLTALKDGDGDADTIFGESADRSVSDAAAKMNAEAAAKKQAAAAVADKPAAEAKKQGAPTVNPDELVATMKTRTDAAVLDADASLIPAIADKTQQERVRAEYKHLRAKLQDGGGKLV